MHCNCDATAKLTPHPHHPIIPSDCRQAKGVISNLNLGSKVGIIELDQESDGADVQAYLADKTGQRTVPNIFINGKHLGGCSDILEADKSGELKKLVGA